MVQVELLDSDVLVPGDDKHDRGSLDFHVGLLEWGAAVDPIHVVPVFDGVRERLVVIQGNHRAAAGFLTRKAVPAKVLRSLEDCAEVGEAGWYRQNGLSFGQFLDACFERCSRLGFWDGGWPVWLARFSRR